MKDIGGVQEMQKECSIPDTGLWAVTFLGPKGLERGSVYKTWVERTV
jgi:hypothetical protein